MATRGLARESRDHYRLALEGMGNTMRAMGDTLRSAYGQNSAQVIAARRAAAWMRTLRDMLGVDSPRDIADAMVPGDDNGRGEAVGGDPR